ncbi:MAG: type IX secretion system membrane protein PorP/SprF [Bacteroidales bacterium]|nr:type IX secretion system membrane protein PorP/SprF [Bacteroidales bacterium]
MKRIYILFIIIVLINLKTGFSQDSQFSQFYASPLYLAPSFAGSTDGDRFSLNYRNQWPAITKSFQTYSLGYDHYFPHLKSGVGLLLFREQAGTSSLSTTNVGLAYSYKFRFRSGWRISPGLSFFYTQRNVNFGELTFEDELRSDQTTGTGELQILEKKADIDASFSVLAFNKNYWFGFTWDRILMPNRSLTGDIIEDPFKFSVYGGTKFKIFDRYNWASGQSISPSFLFKMQDTYTQLDLGLYWYQMPLVIGIWYRGIPVFKELTSNDALAFLLGFKIDQFSIGYSYDLTISKLVGFTGGTHEISINYLFNQGITQREKRKIIPCPSF